MMLRHVPSPILLLFICYLSCFQEANASAASSFLQRNALLRNVTRIANDWKRRLRRDDSDFLWNEAEESYDNTKVTTLGSVILSSLQQPSSKFISRSLLWGMFFYGILEVGKMIASSMEELQQQLNAASSTDRDSSSSSSQVVYGSHPELVSAVIHYCQRQESGVPNANADAEENAAEVDLEDPRFRSACTLALLLRSTGIPFQSSSSERSVETLLRRLNAAEIRFLQQSLYIPPKKKNKQQKHQLPKLIGLSHVQQQIMDTIRHRLRPPDEKENAPKNPFASVFATSDPSNHHLGILLYGPPGCGKTLLIRSLATELQLPCLILTPSMLLHKYFGETNAHVRMLFLLLQNKLAPCILCIDELDGLFRERQADQHEVMGELLTEFLQWMDGMMTKDDASSPPIILIGATNRPFDVDPAILRRLPHAHCVGLPDAATRGAWFQSALSDVPHTISAEQQDDLITTTDGYTYSDLRTWLQAAVIAGPMRRGGNDAPQQLTYDDLMAVRTAPTSGGSARYQERLAQFQHKARRSGWEAPPPSSFLEENQQPVWKTVLGNYYHLGTLEVDGPTMDLLQQIAQELKDYRDGEEGEEE